MIYKVDFNMEKVRSKLKAAHVTSYVSKIASVFVDAEDPDDACSLAIRELKIRVLESRNSKKVQEITKDFDTEVKIKKIQPITPYGNI